MFCVAAAVACKDPGNVTFARRKGPGEPYFQGSVVTYVCDDCCVGGGDVVCHAGNWSQKPTCNGEDLCACACIHIMNISP